MKLSELVTKLGKEERYKEYNSEDLSNELYARAQSALAKARQELNALKSKQRPIDVGLTTTGVLQLSKTRNVDGMVMTGKDPIIKSESLQKISNLIRPLLAATKAMYRSGRTINVQPAHVKDSQGNRTSEVLKQGDGQTLVVVDPVTQLKVILSVLEKNEQAVQALSTIEEVLKDCTIDKLKETKVTERQAKSIYPLDRDTYYRNMQSTANDNKR